MNLSYEQAEAINIFIDRVHSPYYWAFPVALGTFALLEVFLPHKEFFVSAFDRYFTYLKFSLIGFLSLVATSQGFTGGCVVHLVQNWLAQNYLGKEYWNLPYGLVYREYLPADLEWLLRLVYILGGLLSVLGVWVYYRKFVQNTRLPPTEPSVSKTHSVGAIPKPRSN
jgi:hypothetical protein